MTQHMTGPDAAPAQMPEGWRELRSEIRRIIREDRTQYHPTPISDLADTIMERIEHALSAGPAAGGEGAEG